MNLSFLKGRKMPGVKQKENSENTAEERVAQIVAGAVKEQLKVNESAKIVQKLRPYLANILVYNRQEICRFTVDLIKQWRLNDSSYFVNLQLSSALVDILKQPNSKPEEIKKKMEELGRKIIDSIDGEGEGHRVRITAENGNSEIEVTVEKKNKNNNSQISSSMLRT